MQMLAIAFILPFVSLPAHAMTQVYFPQGDSRAVILIKPDPMDASDVDPIKLYDAMNVPPQQTPIATGKTIETPDKRWSLVCGSQGARTVCTLAIRAAEHSRISAIRGSAEFHLDGEAAHALSSLFAATEGRLEYSTADGTLRIQALTRDSAEGPGFHCSFQKRN